MSNHWYKISPFFAYTVGDRRNFLVAIIRHHLIWLLKITTFAIFPALDFHIFYQVFNRFFVSHHSLEVDKSRMLQFSRRHNFLKKYLYVNKKQIFFVKKDKIKREKITVSNCCPVFLLLYIYLQSGVTFIGLEL